MTRLKALPNPNPVNCLMTLGGVCFVAFEKRPAVDLIYSVAVEILRLRCPNWVDVA